MTGTNHGMTGAVIALLVKEPLLAVPLSFASHFVCDAIPHFGVIDKPGEPDNELFTKKYDVILVADFLVAVAIMFILGGLFPSQKWVIWSCMVAAAIPDAMWAYYRLYVEKIRKHKPKYDPLARFHIFIQWSETHQGIILEIVWFVAMGAIILGQR